MNQNPDLERLTRNYGQKQEKGEAALREGNINFYTGPQPSFANRLLAAMLFEPASLAELKWRVLDPIQAIYEDSQLTAFILDRECAVHCTLAECQHTGSAEQWLTEEVADKVPETDFAGLELTFSELITNGDNVLLTSLEIPGIVREARTKLIGIYDRVGQAFPCDILHMTPGRIMSAPSTDYTGYLTRMLELRSQIKDKPLRLKVARLFVGNTLSFLNTKP